MVTTLSMREANQNFSELARRVEAGEEIVVTRHGKPVLRMVPAQARGRVPTPEQEAAWQRFRDFAESGWTASGGWKFSCDEIYEERLDELERRRNRNKG